MTIRNHRPLTENNCATIQSSTTKTKTSKINLRTRTLPHLIISRTTSPLTRKGMRSQPHDHCHPIYLLSQLNRAREACFQTNNRSLSLYIGYNRARLERPNRTAYGRASARSMAIALAFSPGVPVRGHNASASEDRCARTMGLVTEATRCRRA